MSHVTAGKQSETPSNKKDFWNTSDLNEIDRVISEYLEYDEESPTSLTVITSYSIHYTKLYD